MTRYPKLMIAGIGALAFALPAMTAPTAFAQNQSTRQIVVEPDAKKTDAAKKETEEKSGAAKADDTKTEAKAVAATDAKAKTEAANKIVTVPAKEEAAVEKKADETKAAAVTEEKAVVKEEKAAEPKSLSKKEIVVALQTELKRVGCYHGKIDGLWGRRSYAALDAFSHYGKVKHDNYQPSETWIKHVKAKTKTVCKGDYGYARPYGGPAYRPGYRPGPGYDRRPGYGRPPPRHGPRGGYYRY